MKRVFEVDPLICPKCGEQMKIKAFITDSKEITRLCNNIGIVPWHAPPGFITPKAAADTTIEPFFDVWQNSANSGTKFTH